MMFEPSELVLIHDALLYLREHPTFDYSEEIDPLVERINRHLEMIANAI